MATVGNRSPLEVLGVATKLGLTSFGGPVAHIGYFEREYVSARRWVSEPVYADLVALAHFLPGPASSEVGLAVGTIRAGYAGGLAAWLGFTLPSALLLVAFAAGVTDVGADGLKWLRGLQIVAVAVVALAVLTMWRLLAPDRGRSVVAVGAAVVALFWASPATAVVVIAAGAIVGWRLLDGEAAAAHDGVRVAAGSRKVAVACLALFVALLVLLPIAASATENHAVDVADSFYRTGSLVFGGGHVVLPLLQGEVVDRGWVSTQEFVAGYGAAQAVPGPLFTFAAYLGYVMGPEPNGVPGAVLALAAIFLPGILLVLGTLPFWDLLRTRPGARSALAGVNAAVVGLVLAALYDPVFVSAIQNAKDFALAVGAFALLTLAKLPPWAVVALTGLAGAALVAWG